MKAPQAYKHGKEELTITIDQAHTSSNVSLKQIHDLRGELLQAHINENKYWKLKKTEINGLSKETFLLKKKSKETLIRNYFRQQPRT